MAKSMQIDCATGEVTVVDVPDEIKPVENIEEQKKMERMKRQPSIHDFVEAYYQLQKGNSTLMNEWIRKMDEARK